jgi:hypothetical protein
MISSVCHSGAIKAGFAGGAGATSGSERDEGTWDVDCGSIVIGSLGQFT